MGNLQTAIEHQCKGNIDKFAIYVTALLLKLSENGGNDAQAFDKVYEILITSPCSVFNSEIVVYKQVNASNLDVNKLLVKAREEYRTLVTNKTWTKDNSRSKQNTRDRKDMRKPSDIAALSVPTSTQNEIEELKSKLKSVNKANLALRQNSKSTHKPEKSSGKLYTWDEQWGEGKDF